MELCAECETSRAQVICVTESLPYCIPCSSNLHSKKARSNHNVLPIAVNHSNLLHSENKENLDTNSSKKQPQGEAKINPKNSAPNEKIKRKPFPHGNGGENKKSFSSSSEPNGSNKPQVFRNDGNGYFDDIDNLLSGLEEELKLKCRLSGRGQRKGRVTVEAFVVKGDEEERGGDSNADEGVRLSSEHESNDGIRDRIKKILDLWLHPDTPEHEAQQALKNAQRLLTKHNLKQAEVMGGNCKDSEALAGGMCVVELRSKKENIKSVNIGEWAKNLGHVIANNFDTNYYYVNSSPAQIVFYGIKQNAECSGFAYAATFNRITVMSARYDPMQRSLEENECKELTKSEDIFVAEDNTQENKETTKSGAVTLVARNNYRLGIVHGLSIAVKEEKKNHQSDSMLALVLHSKEVGKQVLKTHGIKVRHLSSSESERKINKEAYDQGVADSKEIDINQRGLPTCDNDKKTEHKKDEQMFLEMM